MIIHVVKENETLESIAQNYGVSKDRLGFDNQTAITGGIVQGQALLVLIPEVVYTVIAGDTIEVITSNYGITSEAIVRNNPFLIFQEALLEGQQIIIRYQDEKGKSVAVDGFAYTFITNTIFTETLAYLSELSCFSYGFTTTGELIPIEDENLLAGAIKYGVKSILVLTPFSEMGTFSNELVSILVNDAQVQENLLNNLVQTVQDKNYQGVSIDFEFIRPQDKDAYVEFVRNVKERMSAIGRQVTVCLAPKISSDQPGLLYEGVDYKQLGEIADYSFVMTYEWGYTFSEPMAVSPINKVRKVLDYAVSQIPAAKVRMGMSNYGYDWPLPYQKGITQATVVGNIEAVALAKRNGVRILFDEIAQAPYFNYTKDGVAHQVWFEDPRSIEARLKLITEYGLDGAGYWTIMKTFRANWLIMNAMYNIK